MPENELHAIAQQMVADYKGLLAADESAPTAAKRLSSVGMESTEENRRQYRNLFLTTEGIEQYLSGVIFFEETLAQKSDGGVLFPELLQQKGIIPGIKVDKGAKDLALFSGEKITEGLDGLRERLKGYYEAGCRFAKWRSVIKIEGTKLPSETCLSANAYGLAQYAALVQEAGMVPVVEPEVLYDKGGHDIKRAEQVTAETLKVTFDALERFRVDLKGVILKSSMVLTSKEYEPQSAPDEVAAATIRCFQQSIPSELPGIVFLSGGQSSEQATVNLNAVNTINPGPWKISFSYGRALQGDSLKVWAGKPENVAAAQAEFVKRMKAVTAANRGEYRAA
ncbi:MAG: class I fructose-bisphosphate aldolase [Patescibacteria group bacterium]